MSKLEKQLKAIVQAHPEATVHPNSPSGPYVRAVLWTAADEEILGQAFWDTTADRWVVRAAEEAAQDPVVMVEHPASMGEISAAITRVIERIKNPELAALSSFAPELAAVVRSLRTGT